MKTGLNMGLYAPDLAPLSVVGSSGNRNTCKRTISKQLSDSWAIQNSAYDSRLCRKPCLSSDTNCSVEGRREQLKMHLKFDNWIRHKREFPDGARIHIFSTEKDF